MSSALSGGDAAVDHYEARCMECFWSTERGTAKAARQTVEEHGEYVGCWAAYPYAVYEDGQEARI